MLFADIVGFTSISERRDPEQVKQLVDRAMDRLAADVDAFGGLVDKVLGDALVAIFGAPTAHEDDAERAVRAALKMHDSARALQAEIGVGLELRIGINTGEAVVGAIRADRDYTALGDAVNVASRLQTAAAPGTVLVGRSTYDATHNEISYRPVTPIAARGKELPVEAFEALGAIGLPGERRGRPELPLVGRDGELFVLRRAIEASVRRRRASLILVLGDAGVGKTRLVREVISSLDDTLDLSVYAGRCVPYGEANPWRPMAEVMREALQIPPELGQEAAEQFVRAAVAKAFNAEISSHYVQRAATGLLHLLDYDSPLRSAEALDSSLETGRGIRTFFQAQAREKPVLLWLTDLHWADDVVLRMLNGLLARLSRVPFIIVATARHALADRWSPRIGRYNSLVVSLDPLDAQSAAIVVDQLLGPDLDASLKAQLIARSGGNPFFLEELALLVRDLGVAALTERLPSSVHGLVSARIDALPAAERAVLEDASVVGRQGPVTGLRQLAAALHPEVNSAEALMLLADKDLLVVNRVDSGDWSFRSDLIRDVVYERLTKSERARRHFNIAEYITNASMSERANGATAHHYRRAAELAADIGSVDGVPADVTSRAVTWLSKAAQDSLSSGSAESAERVVTQALALTSDPDERADLLTLRARAAIGQRRFDRAREDLAQARSLDVEQHELIEARVMLRLGEIEQLDGEYDEAIRLLRQAAAVYERLGVIHGVADALRHESMAHLFAGHVEDAERCAQRALDLFTQAGVRGGQAWARQSLAWTAFVRGNIAAAEASTAEAAELFESLGDQGGLAWSRGLLSFVRMHQGRLSESDELAALVLRDARDRGDRWAEAMMLVLRSSVGLWSGNLERAIRLAQDALDIMRAIDDPAGQQQASAFLGRALVLAGRVEDGFGVFDARVSESRGFSGGVTGLVPIAAAASAAAIGDIDETKRRLAGIDLETLEDAFVGHSDCLIAMGLSALQQGQIDEARHLFERVAVTASGEPNPPALAGLAWVAALSGGDVAQHARRVHGAGRATYADRVVAALAEARDAAQRGDAASAREHIAKANAIVDGTTDQVHAVLVALAEAAIEERDGIGPKTQRADHLARSLRCDFAGWRALFALA